MAIFTVARTLLAGSELRRITLPETVWKFRISSTLGSHKRSRRGQRFRFAALSTINMNAREPSSDFPDSLSRLDFSDSRRVATYVGWAFHEGTRDFYRVSLCRRPAKSLLVSPRLFADRGERIGEGRMSRVVPSRLPNRTLRLSHPPLG